MDYNGKRIRVPKGFEGTVNVEDGKYVITFDGAPFLKPARLEVSKSVVDSWLIESAQGPKVGERVWRMRPGGLVGDEGDVIVDRGEVVNVGLDRFLIRWDRSWLGPVSAHPLEFYEHSIYREEQAKPATFPDVGEKVKIESAQSDARLEGEVVEVTSGHIIVRTESP